MKKTTFAVSVFLLTFVVGAAIAVAQPAGPRYGPPQRGGDWNYCPYCGQPYGQGQGYGMGPGRMHRGGRGHGYGMGPGRMYEWGRGPGYGQQYGPETRRPQEPLGERDAKRIVEDYLEYTRNPNVKLGKVKEVEDGFEAEIVTQDGSLADKVFVDKYTGGMHSMY